VGQQRNASNITCPKHLPTFEEGESLRDCHRAQTRGQNVAILLPSLITAYSVQRLVSNTVTTNDYQFSFAYRTVNFNVVETDKLVFDVSRGFVFVSEYNLTHFGCVSWFTGTKDITVANLIHITLFHDEFSLLDSQQYER
jgi:hypothetical protein